MSKQKLELTWIGKDKRPKLEPRILLEDPSKSYHARQRVTESDLFDNRLIFGDNLLALKALEQEFSGKVKCVYIDPPYNTGAAFEHYDDALEHSTWLGLMRDRLEMLRRLLRPDGFICCHIDDSEGHYLKVLLDEVFGRANYLVTLYVQVRYAEKTLKQDMNFHKQVEQIHVYRKDYGAEPNLSEKDLSFDKFCHYITERAPGRKTTLGGKPVTVFEAGQWEVKKNDGSAKGLKEIWATGSILDGNSSGRFFRDYLAGRATADGLGALYKVEGNPVINPEYNAAQLAEALAKLEGFTYAPSETRWWQHGHSSERDFIYVTTQNLSADQLQALAEEVGSDHSLLVCCSAFRGVTAAKAAERWPNLTLKKIPKMVLARCEWGHDDYSLNVANLPMAKPDPVDPAADAAAMKAKGRKAAAAANTSQGGLFELNAGENK